MVFFSFISILANSWAAPWNIDHSLRFMSPWPWASTATIFSTDIGDQAHLLQYCQWLFLPSLRLETSLLLAIGILNYCHLSCNSIKSPPLIGHVMETRIWAKNAMNIITFPIPFCALLSMVPWICSYKHTLILWNLHVIKLFHIGDRGT